MRSRLAIQTIDTHTGGQPTRTVTGGLRPIPGATMLDKVAYCRRNLDTIRRLLMHEPRGSSIMSGVLLTEPCHAECDLGVIFVEVGGYLPMCGHDTIGVCTALIETGQVTPREPETVIRLDTPAGQVTARVQVADGQAQAVTLENVPAFVAARDIALPVAGLGEITVDIAYGGCFYAIVEAGPLGIALARDNAPRLIAAARGIREAVNARLTVAHPLEPALEGVTHVQFVDSRDAASPGRNGVVIPDGSLDRSPCGTGTSARMALLHAQGRLGIGEAFISESLLGSIFEGRILGGTTVGALPAVLPQLTGRAFVTGTHTFFLDPQDIFPQGFEALI